MAGQTAKERVLDALKAISDDATIEEMIEQLCFIAKVEEGLRQSEAGEVAPHDEVKSQLLP